MLNKCVYRVSQNRRYKLNYLANRNDENELKEVLANGRRKLIKLFYRMRNCIDYRLTNRRTEYVPKTTILWIYVY